MVKLHQIQIDHGSVLVVLREQIQNNKIYYIGSIHGSMDEGIYIISESEEDCLKRLKNAIDVALKFWIRTQLHNMEISYE